MDTAGRSAAPTLDRLIVGCRRTGGPFRVDLPISRPGISVSRCSGSAGIRSNERSEIRLLLDSLTNLDASGEVATRAGKLARTHRRTHHGISSINYVIAATAEVHGADLLTQNVKHFPMFSELEPAIAAV